MSYRVLIADDSEVTRSVMRRMMEMAGVEVAEVFEAADGQQALDVIAKEWVDIALVDLNMPRINGIELVTRMSEDGVLVDTPVVVITSERRSSQITVLQQLGVSAVLTKPVRPERLRDVLHEVLGGSCAH